jgi:hypothetical protein
MSGATTGSIAGVGFGCAWSLAGSSGLPRHYHELGVMLSIAISAVLITALLTRSGAQPEAKFRGRVYAVAVVLEVLGIFVAVFALQKLGQEGFLMPAIGFVVGLHFIGLWKALDMSLFLWVAAIMCVLCVIAAFLPGAKFPGGINARMVLSGIGCAVVLWVAGATTLFPGQRSAPPSE